ncbi:putative ATP-dependent RNA helicase suv3 [Rosellinia necatrix]|uniref:RNA helicase n=1 Tax=Rosellinia necatrix TaxID=77044 RepID=A0A1W2TEB0_ROSNE|nr:putative ATP-dependent RNA helicase suv3 [Rosellinia necatrix]
MRFLVMRFPLTSSHLARASRACPSLSPSLSPSPSRYAFSTATRQTARSHAKNTKPPLSQRAAAQLSMLNDDDGASRDRHQRYEARKAYASFRKVALTQFQHMVNKNEWAEKSSQYAALGVTSKVDFDCELKLFRSIIHKACALACEGDTVSRKQNPLFWQLRNAFVADDTKGLDAELRHAWHSFLMRSKFPKNILATHEKIADLRFPHEWFPATRALQRTVHLHVGPTNSGKTYNALKALENAKTGIYAGPLRLLAHEVYTRFQAKGKPCALITGEEQRIPKDIDVYFKSCTVEMAPLNSIVDVAVIDEIQMIGDAERGWAWTHAFLGIQAHDLHLCGEERAVELIQSLCATVGDKCIVHRYERLSGLETMHESLGSLKNLQKGDAVISFSRVGIHSLKNEIETATGRRCAIVYGSLPPETRAQQAALFNEPDNEYDFLVASDAIGMGLNLEIRRVIFEATHKRDKNGFRPMGISELKQIGGRAGRYRTVNHAIGTATLDGERREPEARGPGLVTAIEDEDLAAVISAFKTEPKPMKTAGIQPPVAAIERLSTYFPPNTPLSFIIVRLRDIAKLSSRFHLCGLKDMLTVADLIQPFPMSIYDRCVFLNAPVALRDPYGAETLQVFARCVSRMEGGDLLDIPEINLDLLSVKIGGPGHTWGEHLRLLESLHKSITLYLWLSYRFSGVFTSQGLAFHVKERVETKINELLSGISQSEANRRKRLAAMRRESAQNMASPGRLLRETIAQEEPKPGHERVGKWDEEERQQPLFDDPTQLENITRLEPRPGKQAKR